MACPGDIVIILIHFCVYSNPFFRSPALFGASQEHPVDPNIWVESVESLAPKFKKSRVAAKPVQNRDYIPPATQTNLVQFRPAPIADPMVVDDDDDDIEILVS